MRAALAIAGLAILVLAGCAGTKTVTKTVTVTTSVGATAASDVNTEFGYIRSLTRTAAGYELRFDPAQFTTGITASRAKLEDTGSSEVPNDSYVVNESRRAYTYLVPENARITVLTNDKQGIKGTPIDVAELARIVAGTSHRKLFEPITTGFWMRFHVDSVRSLTQQYLP